VALEVAGQTPARMSIANVSSGESVEAQFNPTEFEEALEVNWARQTVPGLSHQPLQFVNTGNAKFTLELNFEVQDPTTDLEQIHRARRFLQSLCYPRRGAGDVIGGGPPRVLFIWPNVASLTCVINTLSFKYGRFNLDGTPVQFTAKVTLEEIRDVRLVSEDVLASGSQRSGVSRGGV
jgi:Contractile injection system tube protein